jgi:hypothetical protein
VAAAGQVVEEGAVVLEGELDAAAVDDQRALPLLRVNEKTVNVLLSIEKEDATRHDTYDVTHAHTT